MKDLAVWSVSGPFVLVLALAKWLVVSYLWNFYWGFWHGFAEGFVGSLAQ